MGAGVLLVKKSNIDPYYRASLLPAFKLQKWASSIVRYAIKSKDLCDEFAASLSKVDELILLDIYPAREKPIEGVTSQIILDKVTIENKK